MRTFFYAGVMLAVLNGAAIADDAGIKEEGPHVVGTVTEVGPSPYADRGGVGRVVLGQGPARIVFHILKTTKLTQLVDGKAQPAKFEDVKKGATCRAVYDGRVMKSEPPRAWAISFEIVKPDEEKGR